MSRSNESMPHLTDERIQDWLDGRLSASEAARIEDHVDACPRCRAEVEGWQALMGELSVLEELAPRSGFGGRVLDAVGSAAPERVSLAARVRSWLTPPAHPDPVRLQEFVDGTLGRRRAGVVRRHLAACTDCRGEAQRWVALVDGLAALPRHAPSPGFAHAVMSQVRVAPAASTAHSLGRRLLDRGRALAGPRQRRAWAAAAGVAFTPVVTTALIAYVVFSHPLVTVGNLATFVWLKGSTLAAALGGGLFGGVIESASIFNAWSAVGALSPTTAGAGLLGACALTLASAWVLYRNVIAPARQVAHARR
jgi:anti-sigma factor RsiW